MNHTSKHDSVAKIYDEIRPSYPQELISDVLANVKNIDKAKLLEIGAGTGKATLDLAKAGHSIDCIEVGENLAQRLIQKCQDHKNVTVYVKSFEAWKARENEKYDLICSAQAFHWIDPDVKYSKCHSLLKEKGRIALFWYQPYDSKETLTEEIRAIFLRHDPSYYNDQESSETIEQTMDRRRKELETSGFFIDVHSFEYVVENRLSIEMYISALRSFSKFEALEKTVQEAIIEDLKQLFDKNKCEYLPSDLKYYLFVAERL